MSVFGSYRFENIPWVRYLGQKWRSRPRPVPEDSIPLRVFVQAMVIVAIIATDVAADTRLSLWAVPLSILGAIWSGYRRHQPNIVTKFVLAIAMILALLVFLSNLVTTLNDTRIILAELLVQVQVLHTFDLPRRKDLGYSMVIGLILLGVAATVSQTMTFGPFLIVFLSLALPALIFDYRSRLGLSTQPQGDRRTVSWATLKQALPWKRVAVLMVGVLGLGLLLFAVMPRVPGYQLRTFPVSSTIEFQGPFEGRNIVSPEAAGDGDEEGGGGGGNAPEGAGELDDTFYYGFSDRINQNLRGSLTPKVVMRVRSQAPGFWRVTAFDEYTGQGWRISDTDDVQTLTRSPWTFRFIIPFLGARSHTEEVIQTYSIVSDLPGLVPALDQPRYLYFPTQEVAVDPQGAIRSPVYLADGLTYTVISQVSVRDRTRLGNAPTTYPDSIRDRYLQVPPEIRDRLQTYTESVIADAPNPLENPYEIALYLAQYLKQNYQLPQDPFGLEFLDEGEDLVTHFLFRCLDAANPATCSPGGYPDHFSTVLAMMLRSVGIPSRLATGFAPGNFNPFTGLYEVKNTHAFALVEVYFPKHGWFTFDPIPGHDLFPPSVSDYEPFGVLKQFWDWVAGWLPSPLAGFVNGLFTLIGRLIDGFLKLFQRGWLGVLGGLLVFVGCSFAGWLSWQGWREWKHRRWLSKLAQMERLYREMLQDLAREGCIMAPSQTPLEFARSTRDRYPVEVADTIEAIARDYVRWRYGGEAVQPEVLREQWRSHRRTAGLNRRLLSPISRR